MLVSLAGSGGGSRCEAGVDVVVPKMQRSRRVSDLHGISSCHVFVVTRRSFSLLIYSLRPLLLVSNMDISRY
jgi:hypothetical protein